jgi:hypothetical protein
MQHMTNSMIRGVSDNNVWYVDFGASNYMISHGKWFILVEINQNVTSPFTTTCDL